MQPGESGHDCSVVFATHLGWCGVAWSGDAVRRIVFGYPRKNDARAALAGSEVPATLTSRQAGLLDRLQRFAAGEPEDFAHVKVHLAGLSAFQQAVLTRCRRIPWGRTMTYGQLAKAAHRPGAARAVGSVMARNPIPIIIPCHRVVASGANRVGGFSAPGGSVLKQKLLAHEGLSQFTNRSPSLRG